MTVVSCTSMMGSTCLCWIPQLFSSSKLVERQCVDAQRDDIIGLLKGYCALREGVVQPQPHSLVDHTNRSVEQPPWQS